jgi:hypothetical protein
VSSFPAQQSTADPCLSRDTGNRNSGCIFAGDIRVVAGKRLVMLVEHDRSRKAILEMKK